MGYYLSQPQSVRDGMGTMEGLTSCGISNDRAVAAWLWDNKVAMLGTDCPAVETWPWQDFETHLTSTTKNIGNEPVGQS